MTPHTPQSPKLYIIVRNDLSQAQTWVQVSHAALQAGLDGLVDKHPAFVVLGTTVHHLKELAGDMECAVFHDSYYSETLTAIATRIRHEDFDRLRLVK